MQLGEKIKGHLLRTKAGSHIYTVKLKLLDWLGFSTEEVKRNKRLLIDTVTSVDADGKMILIFKKRYVDGSESGKSGSNPPGGSEAVESPGEALP